ncbi:methylenetetrahydrofolate--tRNA-(uracil(54)-C(5))-methyltransferase (FADH(2)-oxidizing) TrmFO [Syntrophorhabdus aromaticivorans]|uniref:methylenetetrahydrofolate--tRNA-(uracil(54)- C(5))-methyltransferase (FADH(2)-oxidizing) TrmFO n=1 Tax=Syntrophorhabdus aromaticivorans TaxID=328301 RepID=UPI0003F7B3D0|nr:methylenetetrahydrofolate--tRNA-(uracil(54)-C(5))-methyltransferase (FADH(2)-oxidizing) TrmFO [Syntrophorhabdus aromaticivorans]
MDIRVVGGGLAGVEAAHQVAQRGHKVTLYEMRPHVFTPAHRTPFLSELVCSNSMKSKELTNAHGLLKEELRLLGSIIVETADETAIPGGKALVVDRQRFARIITDTIEAHPLIRISREEVTHVPDGIVIFATGPLTSDGLADTLRELTGSSNFYFFDAISPIVDGETIDREKAFFGARYLDGSDDYLNCPLTRDEYDRFYEALITAERVQLREFEKTPYFEGCLPIEIMAERGHRTLLYGPMKPVGLTDGITGAKPHAVIQLRREDASGTMYNMVGFQTKLTYTEQERVFKLIPALRNAVFLRYGSIHRNTYINSPAVLTRDLRLVGNERVFLAGQITGVEGYIESAAMGLLAGISACASLEGHVFSPPPEDTCIGALLNYITTENKHFQPMNVNFGLLKGYNKRQKDAVVKNALSAISAWKDETDRLRSPLQRQED